MPEENKQQLTVPMEETKKSDDLKSLVEKNIKWSQIIYEQNKKISRRLMWMVVGDYLKLFLLIAPIIAALLFLPPLFKQFWDQYGSQLSGVNATGVSQNILSGSTGEQVKELLKLLQNK